MSLIAYDLSLLEEDELELGIEESIEFDDIREAIETIIKTIHRIPDLYYEKTSLGEADVYIGRTSQSGLWQRFQYHRRSGRDAIIIIGNGHISRVKRWERAATPILRNLKDNGNLCCGNAAYGSAGGVGVGPAYLYLCWNLGRKKDIGRPRKREVDELAEDVFNRTNESFDDVRDGLGALLRQSSKEAVRWHRDHSD